MSGAWWGAGHRPHGEWGAPARPRPGTLWPRFTSVSPNPDLLCASLSPSVWGPRLTCF